MSKVKINLDDLQSLIDMAETGAVEVSSYEPEIKRILWRLRRDPVFAKHHYAERLREVRSKLYNRKRAKDFIAKYQGQLVWLSHYKATPPCDVRVVRVLGRPTCILGNQGLVECEHAGFTIKLPSGHRTDIYGYEEFARRVTSVHVSNLALPDAIPGFRPEDYTFEKVR